MAENTGIEWTNATWNPTVGCSVLSAGCTNCYAMRMAGRLEMMGSEIYRGHTIKTKAGHVWNGKVGASNHGQMIKPLSWKTPRRIFVNSMSDLFHEDMPEDVIDQVFAVMALCPQHTFQVLTKRSARMLEYMSDRDVVRRWVDHAPARPANPNVQWQRPLRNVWLGVSVEDQTRADERIPHLLATPAAIRFLSCEPLLGSVNIAWALGHPIEIAAGFLKRGHFSPGMETLRHLDWAIVGGESGPKHRPMKAEWARLLRDQCANAGVAFFFKQMAGRSVIPDDLLIREFPP